MLEIEVEPDWQVVRTAVGSESYFTGFKFKGPGWYHIEGTSMLVHPVGSHAAPFKSSWPEDQLFRFLVYNDRDPVESFREAALAPVRSNDR